jgi:beta-glucosidase-like glycosyl hydrolase
VEEVQALDEGWVEREFKTVDFGDERMNKRLKVIATAQGAQPSASLNQASGDWAATKAAYRFFENERVTAEELLAPHQWETQKRMATQALVLAVQDTTYLNDTNRCLIPTNARLKPKRAINGCGRWKKR